MGLEIDSQMGKRRIAMWMLAAAALIAVALSAFLLAMRWVDDGARQQTEEIADARLSSNAGLIASELQKFRLLPLVLADYPDVDAVLAEGSPAAIAKLNRTLEMLAGRTDAAVIYVIDRNGMTLAASNWRQPESFVGQRYGFRSYFRDALAKGSAEQFALGTVSRRPGLFLARRSSRGDGVVVVKVEFDRIERDWIRQSGPTFVRDANGVIIISSRPEWRLHATRPLSAQMQQEVRQTRQYGDDLPPLVAIDPGNGAIRDNSGRDQSLIRTADVPVPGWTLSAVEPLDPARRSLETQAKFAGLAASLVLLVVAGLIVRTRERRALAAEAKRALEDEVRRRTAELSSANEQLVLEHAKRGRNEAKLRAAREELAQANRLGVLGQITAGVAHEINQPVTAIGTFAANAIVMSDRSNFAGARENMSHIVELTKRIGQITSELRLFARRDNPRGPVRLAEAIDGALLLMGDRLRRVAIERVGDFTDVSVTADRVRLEQVIINLLQNASDALDGHDAPRIELRVEQRGKWVHLAIADNGPGLPDDKRDHVFTPFVTSKRDGLGLGLAIALDIARDFGGELTHDDASGGGATFTLRLRKA